MELNFPELVGGLNWADAILGVVLGAGATGGVAVARFGWRAIWDRRPLKRFLGALVDNSEPLSIFAREMVSIDGKYYSQLPSGRVQEWQNFPVVGLVDVEAATDALNLLGQVGGGTNLFWRRVTTDSGRWDEPSVCIGASFRSDKVLELCEPRLVSYCAPDVFEVPNRPPFKADADHDYGLIARLWHPETGAQCVVLFGCGMAGTAAAGHYWRQHAPSLARIYGARGFAIILRVGWHDGPASAEVAWMSENSGAMLKLLHPRIWAKHKALLSAHQIR